MKKYNTIIFDIDGTILDSEHRNTKSLHYLLNKYTHLKISFDELKKYMGRPGKEILTKLGFEGPQHEEIFDRWFHISYDETIVEPASIFDGIQRTLYALKRSGIDIGIVSSKDNRLYELDIKPLNIDHYFESVVLFEDTLMHKPHPAPLLKYLENTNKYPEKCLYIGDVYTDFECAKDAKIDFGLALWGASEKFTISPNDHYLKDPQDILRLI